MVQIVKMKDLCAEKVEEAKQRIKEAEDKSKEIAFKYEKESNDVEEKIQQKVKKFSSFLSVTSELLYLIAG